ELADAAEAGLESAPSRPGRGPVLRGPLGPAPGLVQLDQAARGTARIAVVRAEAGEELRVAVEQQRLRLAEPAFGAQDLAEQPLARRDQLVARGQPGLERRETRAEHGLRRLALPRTVERVAGQAERDGGERVGLAEAAPEDLVRPAQQRRGGTVVAHVAERLAEVGERDAHVAVVGAEQPLLDPERLAQARLRPGVV